MRPVAMLSVAERLGSDCRSEDLQPCRTTRPRSAARRTPYWLHLAMAAVQGMLGANFGPGLMTAVGIKDTIARGLAAAGTAGAWRGSARSLAAVARPSCVRSKRIEHRGVHTPYLKHLVAGLWPRQGVQTDAKLHTHTAGVWCCN